MWDNKVFTLQIAKYFGVGGLKLYPPFKNAETVLWFIISHGRQWSKTDLAETSELYDKSLLNSSVKTSITFTIFGCNELILLLLQKLVHFLNVTVQHFVLVVILHAADIIACASDGIDVVDEAASTLIRPTSEVLDRVDVLFWFQEVWSMDWEWL